MSWEESRASLAAWMNRFECIPVEPDPIIDYGLTLVDKRHGECSWPIGIDTDGQYRFCGKQNFLRKSYCGFHYTKSLATSEDMEPEVLARIKFGRDNEKSQEGQKRGFGYAHEFLSLDEAA